MPTTMPAIAVRLARTRSQAEEWALVLEAEDLSPNLERTSQGFVVSVPPECAERAAAALEAYDSENRATPDSEVEWAGPAPLYAAVTVSSLILIFFLIVVWTDASVRWYDKGSAAAMSILRGEYWRTVTALTLHADWPHVLANTVAGVFLLTALGRVLGPGLAAAMVVVAGAGGNLLNAWLHGSFHVSVGASTAVFGALGVLGGTGVVKRHGRGFHGRNAWMPLGAGLALLAVLGTGGQRVDIWAHLMGFVAGAGLGMLITIGSPHPPALRTQWTLGALAAAVVILCWVLALIRAGR